MSPIRTAGTPFRWPSARCSSLREKSRTLEGKLRELVQFGEENDVISDRVHRVTLALLAARDLPALLESCTDNLREDFARARRGAAAVVARSPTAAVPSSNRSARKRASSRRA